jgi:hypothetical protein
MLVLGISLAEAFGCLCPERIAGQWVSPCSASHRLYAAIHSLAAHAISCSTAVNRRPRMSW